MDKQNNNYCVYMHISPSEKKYIGITKQSTQKRWQYGYGYLNKNTDGTFKQPAMARAVLKYSDWNNDWQHLILMDNLTEGEAKEAEMLFIKKYNTRNPNYGYNITAGGDGMHNCAHTEETKQKISLKAKERFSNPKNHPMYGKHPSDETREKQKIRASQRWQNPEERQKMSEIAKERFKNPLEKEKVSRTKIEKGTAKDFKNPRARAVYCIDLNRIFWGAKEAHEEFGVDQSAIAACCRKKYGFKSAGKHPNTHEPLHWLYAEDAITDGYITQKDLDYFYLNLRQGGGVSV